LNFPPIDWHWFSGLLQQWIKKDFKHARMASLAVSNRFWARLKSGFSEHLAI